MERAAFRQRGRFYRVLVRLRGELCEWVINWRLPVACQMVFAIMVIVLVFGYVSSPSLSLMGTKDGRVTDSET